MWDPIFCLRPPAIVPTAPASGHFGNSKSSMPLAKETSVKRAIPTFFANRVARCTVVLARGARPRPAEEGVAFAFAFLGMFRHSGSPAQCPFYPQELQSLFCFKIFTRACSPSEKVTPCPEKEKPRDFFLAFSRSRATVYLDLLATRIS